MTFYKLILNFGPLLDPSNEIAKENFLDFHGYRDDDTSVKFEQVLNQFDTTQWLQDMGVEDLIELSDDVFIIVIDEGEEYVLEHLETYKFGFETFIESIDTQTILKSLVQTMRDNRGLN